MGIRAINVLCELSHIWKFIGRDKDGSLKVFTDVPTYHDSTGYIQPTRGNVLDLSFFDNGAFDEVVYGTPILISQYTHKTFFK